MSGHVPWKDCPSFLCLFKVVNAGIRVCVFTYRGPRFRSSDDAEVGRGLPRDVYALHPSQARMAFTAPCVIMPLVTCLGLLRADRQSTIAGVFGIGRERVRCRMRRRCLSEESRPVK